MFEKEWGPSGFFSRYRRCPGWGPGFDSPLRTPWTPGVENKATPILHSGPARVPQQRGDKKGDNKKGDKKGEERKQKGDETDTMTNKKGDKTGDKGDKKGDKADTRTNKKGDKRKQKGHKTDTVTNNKGDKTRNRRKTRRTQ